MKERRSLGEVKGGLLQAREARGEVRKPECQRRGGAHDQGREHVKWNMYV